MNRIRNIFEAATENDVKVLILGAFRDPPEIVAAAFKDVIDDNGYARQFEKIVFAVKKSEQNKNYKVFFDIFDKQS